MTFRPFTRAQIRELDRRAIGEFGIPGIVLMENASRGLAEAAASAFPDPARVLVIAGAGNNGGDGFAAARHLHNRGWEAVVALFAERGSVGGDAEVNLAIIERMGIPVLPALRDDRIRSTVYEMLIDPLAPRWLVLDCLFGTGLSRPVEGPAREVINLMNACPHPVVGVDIPSGLDCDTGRPLGTAVNADLTVTFVAPKIGFDAPEAAEYLGRVEVVREIGIPRELIEEAERGG